MMIIFIFLAGFILFALIYLFFSNVTLTIHYQHQNQNDQLMLSVKALNGLYVKKMNVPVIESQVQATSVKVKGYRENPETGSEEETRGKITPDKIKDTIQKSMEVIRQVHNLRPILKQFAKKIKVSQFRLHTTFGTGEAVSTGKLTGLVWSMAGIVQALIFTFLTVMCRPDFTVVPQFNQKTLDIEWKCIIKLRVGDAILTACKLFYHWKGIKFSSRSFPKRKLTKQSENENT